MCDRDKAIIIMAQILHFCNKSSPAKLHTGDCVGSCPVPCLVSGVEELCNLSLINAAPCPQPSPA